MSDHTHIVRFVEVTPHEAQITAADGAEAITVAERMLKTLSPAARAKTFMALTTTHEHFTAEPLRKPYRVAVEVRASYEIELEAHDEQDAVEKAEDRWNANGPDSFSFGDFMDVHFEAEEVDQ